MTNISNKQSPSVDDINQSLLCSVIKINTYMLAIVFGLIGGLGLFAVTYMSMLRGLPNPGHYLNLLGVFLPGYSVSHTGAWIGMLWGGLIGALMAAVVYRIYSISIPEYAVAIVREGAADDDDLGVTMRFNGNYLGLAFGGAAAAGLLLTTNLLVIRGTADQSVHAQLLVNYLPGYSVSTVGSFIGALELFVVVYILVQFFSVVYNSIVSLKTKSSG